MPKFGAFTTVELLHTTALGRVYAARRDGDAPDAWPAFVVKTREPDAAVYGEDEAAAVLDDFRKAAKAQQRLGAAAGSGFAPIHDIGEFTGDSGRAAFYVTDRAARGSAERLTGSQQAGRAAGADARVLANVVRQVVGALGAAAAGGAEGGGRPHGNLSPMNVLFMDDAPPARARVALTDPVSDERAAAMGRPGVGRGAGGSGQREDARALGRLIYRLVMRREFSGGWPVEITDEWRALGRTGEAWRDLCNKLLDPDPRSGVRIEQVGSLIPEDRAPAGTRRLRVLGAAAAVVLLLVAVGAYLVFGRTVLTADNFKRALNNDPGGVDQRWQRWVQVTAPSGVTGEDRPGWIGRLLDGVPSAGGKVDARVAGVLERCGPEVVERVSSLAALRHDPGSFSALAKLSFADWKQTNVEGLRRAVGADQGDSRRDPLERFACLSDAADDKTAQALAKVDELKKYLTDTWPPGHDLARAVESSAGWPEAWKDAREFLGKQQAGLSEIDDLPAGTDVVTLLERVLAAAEPTAKIVQSRTAIEAASKAIEAARGDEMSRSFAANWAGMAAAAGAGSGSGAADGPLLALVPQLAVIQEKLAAVQAALTDSGSSGTDLEDLGEQVRQQIERKELDPAKPTLAAMDQWLALAAGSKRIPGGHPGGAEGLAEKLRGIDTLVRDSAEVIDEDLAQAFRARRDRLGEQIDSWGKLRPVARNNDRLESDARRMTADVDALSRELTTDLALARKDASAKLEELKAQIRGDEAWKSIRSGAIRDLGRARLGPLLDEQNATPKRIGAERTKWVKLLEAFDKQIEAPAVRSAPAAAGAGESWQAKLGKLADSVREEKIARAINGLPKGEIDASALTAAAKGVNEAIGAWGRSMAELTADMEQVESLLTTRFSLDDAGEPGKPSAMTLWRKWTGTGEGLGKDPGVVSALDPLAARITLFERVAKLAAPDLRSFIDQARPEAFDATIAAWERLTDPGAGLDWPKNLDDFRSLPGLRDKARAAARAGAHESIRAAIDERLNKRLAQTWNQFAAAQARVDPATKAQREAALAGAIEQMSEFGVSPADVADPRIRLSIRLASLRKELKDKPDDAVPALAQAFADEVGRVLPAPDPPVRALLSEVRRVVDNPEKGPKVTELGPGAAGLPGEDLGEGRLRFTIAGEQVEFRRVDLPNGGSAYLAVQEMSVGLFRKIVSEKQQWPAVKDDGWLDPDPNNPAWQGPCAWKWDGKGNAVTASSTWIAPDGPDFAARPLHVGGRGADLPPQLGANPSGAMPMHRISAAGAASVAQMVRCELPSLDEWVAAYRLLARGPGAGDNLRDQTFAKQAAYSEVSLRPNQGWAPIDYFAPDRESFAPGGLSSPIDDRTLYFWKVTDGASGPFQNLIGNVAEFARGPGQGYVVLGASALSDTAIAPDQPTAEGFAKWDVGFRLSFSATGAKVKSLSEQVLAVLGTNLLFE